MSDPTEKKRHAVRRIGESMIVLESEQGELAVDLAAPIHCTHVNVRANGPLYQLVFYYVDPIKLREGEPEEPESAEIELPMVFAKPAAKIVMAHKALPGLIAELQKIYKMHETKEGRMEREVEA